MTRLRCLHLSTVAIALSVGSAFAADPSAVQRMIADETKRQIGAQWVPVALRIAKLESGYRCNAVGPRTRHGRAVGVFQVLPSSAERLERGSARYLTNCQTGVRVGVKHMQVCIASGVRTERQMAACHVSGVFGWQRRLRGAHESYKRQYVAWVTRRQ